MTSSKVKVLVFTDWYLPGYKAGGPITSLSNMVEQLKNDIDFYVITSDRDYLESHPYEGVSVNSWNNKDGIKILYLSPNYQSYSIIKRSIAEFQSGSQPGLIYLSGIFSKTFSIIPLILCKKLGISVCVAPRGMLAATALQLKGTKKRTFLSLAKLIGLFKKVDFHATSIQESKDIEIQFRDNQIFQIPNFPTLSKVSHCLVNKRPNHLKVLSVARIAPEKNILFALRCLSNISSRISIEAIFVGEEYDGKYAKLCRELIAKMPENIVVKLVGSKSPSEIQETRQSCHLFFSPTLGENYGHAIVESLLDNTPVLISNRTPWKNLENEKMGADFELNSETPFIEYIYYLAHMDKGEYLEYIKDIRFNILKKLNVEEMVHDYKAMFHEIS